MKELKECVICGTLHYNELTCSIQCRSRLDSLRKTGIKLPHHSKTMKEKYKNGYENWNKGLTKETDDRVMNNAESLKGIKRSKECIEINRLSHLGKKATKETREKMSKSNSGKNHWNWQNGKTELIHRLRGTDKYKKWRNKVYKRDNYTCQICGNNKSGNLEAHHIKLFSKYPKSRYDINNGITLCKSCHCKLTHHKLKVNKLNIPI